MTSEERAKYRKILPMCAAVTAIVCVIILFFFRTSVFGIAITRILGILAPFIYGAVIAYIMRPVCLFLENLLKVIIWKITKKEPNGFPRAAAILLSIVFMLAMITLLLVAILPEIISSISGLIAQIEPAITSFQKWLSGLDRSDLSHELVGNVSDIVNYVSDWLETFLQNDLLPTLQSILPNVTSGFMDVLDVLYNFGLGCIIAAYILASWEKFVFQARIVLFAIFPERIAEWFRGEVHYANNMFSGFISGKILDSLIVGVVCFIFMNITRMPFTVLVSVLIGVTNLIPFFGQFLCIILSALMILIESPSAAFVFLIFIVILMQIDGNLIAPRILGGKLGISGFWILFSIIFFGALLGPIGMLIGVPLYAVIYDFLKTFFFDRLKKKGKIGLAEEYQREFHADELPVGTDAAKSIDETGKS